MTTTALLDTRRPLGSFARPARGRAPGDRFTFASCTEDNVAAVGHKLAHALAHVTGPTRCSLIAVQTARGDDAVTATLAELATRGQGPAVLANLREGYDAIAAQAACLGQAPVFVVVHCAVLWTQSARLVPCQ